MSSNKLESFIYGLDCDRHYAQNIVARKISPAQAPEYRKAPDGLRSELLRLLAHNGIDSLYAHQSEAMELVLAGKNIVLSSGVASGKSLCYQIPILNELLHLPASRSLLLYPTKALAQDQSKKLIAMAETLKAFTAGKFNPKMGIYDGDTDSTARGSLRKSASVIFSNPDMLHLAILPNHTLWSTFFANLRYVVIDEVHIYRGVFGSQFANVLRRLKRVCRMYGSKVQFIFTSATLANSQYHCQNLIEAPVEIVSRDASGQGERHFYIFNPPLVNRDLGIRRSSIVESCALSKRFLKTGCQGILFTETRRNVEILFVYLLDKLKESNRVKSYRSGYLAENRREVETELREKKLDLVVSTNALELGIDIGGLDAVFINGYPGTICATIQQSGRAGRKGGTSLAILVATSNVLDQYICRHPEYLFEKNPEQALIDPNNTDILLRHLHCAICEMALLETENFGALEPHEILPYLQILQNENKIRKIGSRFVGQVGDYPAADISLRNMSSQLQLVTEEGMIGYVDEESAHWMTHPGAIYLHNGETWRVNSMDLESRIVELEYIRANYYTQAAKQTSLSLDQMLLSATKPHGKKYLGNVTVTTQVVGFKKIRFHTQELLGFEDLELPSRALQTVAWWISLSGQAVQNIREKGLWRNAPNDYGPGWNKIKDATRARDGYLCQHCRIPESGRAHDVHHIIPFRKFSTAEEANRDANLITLCPRCHRLAEQSVMIQSGLAAVSYLLGNLAPLYVMCEQKDIGVHSEESSELASGDPIIVIYDSVPGGIGLSKKLYHLQEKLVSEALLAVQNCPCEIGCPSCVGPVAENGEGAKEHALAILEELNSTD